MRAESIAAVVAATLAAACPAAALTTAPGVAPRELLAPPGAFSGVGKLVDVDRSKPRASLGCTATLLTTGRHVLTASHCVKPGPDVPNVDLGRAVRFQAGGARVKLRIVRWRYPPERRHDIAVGELAEPAPPWMERHDIYRQHDEVGRVFTKVSYGPVWRRREPGFLKPRARPAFAGRKVAGENRFDVTGRPLFARADRRSMFVHERDDDAWRGGVQPEDWLVFDADDGRPGHDAAGMHLGLVDLGLGRREVNANGGDSGSPSFLDGKVAGLTVLGTSDLSLFLDEPRTDVSVQRVRSLAEARRRFRWADDLVPSILDDFDELAVPRRRWLLELNNVLSDDASYGEFSLEQRVSSMVAFIDEQLAKGS